MWEGHNSFWERGFSAICTDRDIAVPSDTEMWTMKAIPKGQESHLRLSSSISHLFACEPSLEFEVQSTKGPLNASKSYLMLWGHTPTPSNRDRRNSPLILMEGNKVNLVTEQGSACSLQLSHRFIPLSVVQFPGCFSLRMKLRTAPPPSISLKWVLWILVPVLVENRTLESDKSGIGFHYYVILLTLRSFCLLICWSTVDNICSPRLLEIKWNTSEKHQPSNRHLAVVSLWVFLVVLVLLRALLHKKQTWDILCLYHLRLL